MKKGAVSFCMALAFAFACQIMEFEAYCEDGFYGSGYAANLLRSDQIRVFAGGFSVFSSQNTGQSGTAAYVILSKH